jgi:hypothetical protein
MLFTYSQQFRYSTLLNGKTPNHFQHYRQYYSKDKKIPPAGGIFNQ